MATLNVKNVSDVLYKKLRARARRQHRSVAQEVVHLLEEAVKRPTSHSILELGGLGKELWRGIDAAKHVKRERHGWD
jgi:plasmid stability protein